MVPAGYMAKKVVRRPDWIKSARVEDVYSVSGCISENFDDYIKYWRHNGHWFFDSPQIIESVAREHEIDLRECRVFFYEVFEEEFNDENRRWEPFKPDGGFETSVAIPARKQLEGYDVVTFSVHTSPECSPLSCNNLAETIKTNQHCLFASFEEAKAHIEANRFDNSEPGPFRIFAVYSVGDA
jgi:hypothetical protein